MVDLDRWVQRRRREAEGAMGPDPRHGRPLTRDSSSALALVDLNRGRDVGAHYMLVAAPNGELAATSRLASLIRCETFWSDGPEALPAARAPVGPANGALLDKAFSADSWSPVAPPQTRW